MKYGCKFVVNSKLDSLIRIFSGILLCVVELPSLGPACCHSYASA